MSREIKYIGMDVHKEAIVIAVLNGSGKLVMESVVETKASSILQFIHGHGKKYRGAVLKIDVLTVSLELEKTREKVLLPYDQIRKADVNLTLREKIDSLPALISK